MRDGRTLEGYLRSYDQFSNLVLEETVERITVGNEMAKVDVGLYMVRGDAIMIMGEPDTDALETADSAFTSGDPEDIRQKQHAESVLKQASYASRRAALLSAGVIDDDLDA